MGTKWSIQMVLNLYAPMSVYRNSNCKTTNWRRKPVLLVITCITQRTRILGVRYDLRVLVMNVYP